MIHQLPPTCKFSVVFPTEFPYRRWTLPAEGVALATDEAKANAVDTIRRVKVVTLGNDVRPALEIAFSNPDLDHDATLIIVADGNYGDGDMLPSFVGQLNANRRAKVFAIFLQTFGLESQSTLEAISILDQITKNNGGELQIFPIH